MRGPCSGEVELFVDLFAVSERADILGTKISECMGLSDVLGQQPCPNGFGECDTCGGFWV